MLAGEVTRRARGAQALVDVERRRSISRAHTATHMVHKAFREALGETATQAGSENAPGRFRFDFSATGAVPASVMADVEARVNDLMLADLPVHAELMSQAEAVAVRRDGALRREVRRRRCAWSRSATGPASCAAAPTPRRSGQLGVVKLLGESSIGSGVRRVEALVGADAYRFLAREHVLVAQLTDALKVRPEQLPERVADLVERLRTAEKEIEKVRVAAAAGRGRRAGRRAPRTSSGVAFVGHRVDGAGGGDVRTLALDVRGRLPAGRPGVVVVIVGSGRRQAVGGGRGQRRGPRARDLRQRAGAARVGRCSAAGAAARPTSPRAAAPTRPASTRRSRWSRAAVGARTGRLTPMRRGVRLGDRPRRRADRRGPLRPFRAPRDPGRDRAARGGRPGPARGALARRTRPSGRTSACRARSPGARGRRRRKVRAFAGQLAARLAPVPVRLCRRAVEHRDCRGGAARPGPQGQQATRRGRPGGGGGDPAGGPRHRAQPPGARAGRAGRGTDRSDQPGRERRRRAARRPHDDRHDERPATGAASRRRAPPVHRGLEDRVAAPRGAADAGTGAGAGGAARLPARPGRAARARRGGLFGGTLGPGQIQDRFAAPRRLRRARHGSVSSRSRRATPPPTIGRNLKAATWSRAWRRSPRPPGQRPKSRGIQVGYYRLKKQMRAADALAVLVDPGNLVQALVTVPEGCAGPDIVTAIGEEHRHPAGAGHRRSSHGPAGARPAARGEGQPRGLPVPGHLHGAAEGDRRSTLLTADGRPRRAGRAATLDLERAGAEALGFTPEQV